MRAIRGQKQKIFNGGHTYVCEGPNKLLVDRKSLNGEKQERELVLFDCSRLDEGMDFPQWNNYRTGASQLRFMATPSRLISMVYQTLRSLGSCLLFSCFGCHGDVASLRCGGMVSEDATLSPEQEVRSSFRHKIQMMRVEEKIRESNFLKIGKRTKLN